MYSGLGRGIWPTFLRFDAKIGFSELTLASSWAALTAVQGGAFGLNKSEVSAGRYRNLDNVAKTPVEVANSLDIVYIGYSLDMTTFRVFCCGGGGQGGILIGSEVIIE